jgi:hypothetical protein
MSFVKPEFPTKAKAPERDVTRCPAYGCRLRATVSVGGQGFCCPVHAFAAPDEWPTLTRRLNDHEWLTTFIDDLQLMDQKSQDWRGFAMRFWEKADLTCQPQPSERAVPYQNRMRGELLHRVGQLSKKPQAKEVKQARPSGRFAHTTTDMVAA